MALIFLVIGALFVILLVPRIMKVEALKKRSSDLDTELKKLQTENKSLETELQLLREDPTYIEKVARQKLNKAKPGEIVYKIVPDEQGR